MNREILFRGKRTDNRGWAEGSLISLDADGGSVFIVEPYLFASTLPTEFLVTSRMRLIERETLCQYTGVDDINKKKVWENDIVKTNQGRICKVVWFSSPQHQGWDLAPLEFEHPASPRYSLWDGMEVIGNIFDNPELLKQ